MQTGTENRAGGTSPWRSRWWMPTWCLLLGGVLLIGSAIGGRTTDGLILAAIFVVAAVGFYLAERSDSLRGFGGAGGDERFASIGLRSMANAGTAMAIAVVVAWIVELAQGDDGATYSWILAIGAVAYLGTMEYLRRNG